MAVQAFGKKLEPKLNELDRRQAERYAQQTAQRTQRTNAQTHDAAMSAASRGPSQPTNLSREEQRRAKSKDRTWDMHEGDPAPAKEPRRFRSASPEHPGLNPRVRAITPPGTIRAEEWAQSHAPPDPMYHSSPPPGKAEDRGRKEEKKQKEKETAGDGKKKGGLMNKLKKKMAS
jgi:hypothetical protein